MAVGERGTPVRMQRIVLVCPTDRLRAALTLVAATGTVQLDALVHPGPPEQGPARLSRTVPDLPTLARDGRADLLAGEAQLEELTAGAVTRGDVVGLAAWVPSPELPGLATALAREGAAALPLAAPRGVDPPTMLVEGGAVRRSFTPLVTTYAVVPYADLDPTLVAGAAFVVMFGMMFGDVGHGLLLVLAGLLLRAGIPARAAAAHRWWPFLVAAGGAATVAGLLYGELLGPTGLLPVLWLRPLDHPLTLLAVAIGVGAVLLAGAYVLGAVNRWREAGWAFALVSASGLAGAAVFAGAGLLLLGLVTGPGWVAVVGGGLTATGLALSWVGFHAGAGGGAAAAGQASVEVLDTALRTGANVVSFARLAAFGLTHAALGLVVWELTVAVWDRGAALAPVAVLAFLAGNALAFALEALVAGVQALRLSYYELFSRVFVGEGSPFTPWRPEVEESPQRVGGPS